MIVRSVGSPVSSFAQRRDGVAVDVPDELRELVEQANDGVGFCG
jgi:hypothetical protein